MVSRRVPSGIQARGRTRRVTGAMPGTLVVLRQIYEAAMSQEVDAFEPFAVRCLGRLIGFDGAVWGSGVVAPGSQGAFSITRASLVDRCLLYTSPSPRDRTRSRMPSSA